MLVIGGVDFVAMAMMARRRGVQIDAALLELAEGVVSAGVSGATCA